MIYPLKHANLWGILLISTAMITMRISADISRVKS